MNQDSGFGIWCGLDVGKMLANGLSSADDTHRKIYVAYTRAQAITGLLVPNPHR